MRRWKIDLRDGRTFELECALPPSVTEITPPPRSVPQAAPPAAPAGKATLTVKEAAELIGVCPDNVYSLVHRADFPAFRIGKRWLIDARQLPNWIARQAEGVGA